MRCARSTNTRMLTLLHRIVRTEKNQWSLLIREPRVASPHSIELTNDNPFLLLRQTSIFLWSLPRGGYNSGPF